MSIKKVLFKSIGEYLISNLTKVMPESGERNEIQQQFFDLDLPDIKSFDKQMGQFTSPELFYGAFLPCILMEYLPFTWVTIGNHQQRGAGTIRFWIYFENYADSFTGAINQELALRFFDFTEIVNVALQGLSLPGMQALERIGDNEDNAQDMIITSYIDYSTVIMDTSTDVTRNMQMVDPGITVTRLKKTTRPEATQRDGGFII